MQTIALAISALLLAGAAGPREGVDCARELSDARQLFAEQSADRLAFAAPLVRAVRTIVEHTLTEEDRVLIRGYKDGTVSAGALDRRLWPKLRRAFSRFNAAACRGAGGVASADELVDGLTAMAGGEGLHTSVLVTCADRRAADGRRFLGLRVRPDTDGPTLVLQGLLEHGASALFAPDEPAALRRVTFQIPLGEREAEDAALDGAIAEYLGREGDFTWVVPAACRQRLSSAGLTIP